MSLPILISVRNENHAFGAPVTAAVCAAVVSFCAEALAPVQVRKRRARVAVRIVALFIVFMFLGLVFKVKIACEPDVLWAACAVGIGQRKGIFQWLRKLLSAEGGQDAPGPGGRFGIDAGEPV